MEAVENGSVSARARRPVVLHVEDDLDVADTVKLAFDRFGFRGTMLRGATVDEAISIIDAHSDGHDPIDLIITDVRLPGGSGLDVVRHARHKRATATTPILVLSGEVDPQRVDGAYSLGANTFITKGMAKGSSKRSLLEVVRTLYDHWLRDAQLPPHVKTDGLQELLARMIAGRGRHANFCLYVASHLCGASTAELGFWLGSALREANVANLLSFLRNVTESDVPPELLRALEDVEDAIERDLDEIERAIERAGITSCEEAYHAALALERSVDVDPISRAIAHLLPMAPVPMCALRDLIAGNLRFTSAWIGAHAKEPAARQSAHRMRTEADRLEELVQARVAREPSAQTVARIRLILA
jgi:CheY-like chemotaxis protein